jgi:4'-phosphopantetheinyl transferase
MIPVDVHCWPQDQAQALMDLKGTHGLTVIRVDLPDRPPREVARKRIRIAVRETIAAFLQVSIAEVRLRSQPGQALTLEFPQYPIGVSISHEEGISVAALHLHGRIGIDLMRIDHTPLPDWEPVTIDYLGPIAYERLVSLPAAQRTAAFADAWTGHEARLKCWGLTLTEWAPALAQQLTSCRAHPLNLSSTLRGAVALMVD